MSGAWWADSGSAGDDNATAWVAGAIKLRAPQGPVEVKPDQQWEERIVDALECCHANYRGLSVVKGASAADFTFHNVMGVAISIAWIVRALEENRQLDVDELVWGMATAQHCNGHQLPDCTLRATKLVLDACGELLSLVRLARHSLAVRVTYSAVADARGVDAVLKLWRRPESSVQVKRSYKPPPSSPGRWNINVHYASGESEWIEPASVAIATTASVDAYVKVCTASADAAFA
jgi:hypothetical protein